MLSIITPYVQIATDGKEPAIEPFCNAIAEVLLKACNAAHRAMEPQPGTLTTKDAASQVMEKAYLIASGNGQYPANARQIMYAARPEILRLTGKDKLGDHYFIQTLLPNYINEHENTDTWDVVFDARGSFFEPHTGRDVAVGTIDVRSYLGYRPPITPIVSAGGIRTFPTAGPKNRYRTVLYIEKEGFAPLLEKARIAERFDIAIMSSKGMSTTAARMLLDGLAPDIDKVLVMHDFDVSGFSIFGTLHTDGRRYSFKNELPIFDIGLRLTDVEQMKLQSEPTQTSGDWEQRIETLRLHGATGTEIRFLRSRRVELNAMPSNVFIDFIERKLAEHGVCKLVPNSSTLEQHARRVIEQNLVNVMMVEARDQLQAQAAIAALPHRLSDRVSEMLQRRPELSWDNAVADIVQGDP